MRFTWDPAKAKANLKKHKVSFEEAVTVFLDENARRIFDPDHSDEEERWIFLGLSRMHRMLVVVFVERRQDTIRIISARRANRFEISQYSEFLP